MIPFILVVGVIAGLFLGAAWLGFRALTTQIERSLWR
jgi:hypothetical protein